MIAEPECWTNERWRTGKDVIIDKYASWPLNRRFRYNRLYATKKKKTSRMLADFNNIIILVIPSDAILQRYTRSRITRRGRAKNLFERRKNKNTVLYFKVVITYTLYTVTIIIILCVRVSNVTLDLIAAAGDRRIIRTKRNWILQIQSTSKLNLYFFFLL